MCDYLLMIAITGIPIGNHTFESNLGNNCTSNTVCTKGYISLNRAEVNHAPGSYVYTMGILYRRISTWRTEQLVNTSRRYVAT